MSQRLSLMLIKSLLTQELTFARMDGVSKKRVIDSIAELFSKHSDGIDPSTLFKHLINREKLGSTGIGHGVAIPHCRFATGGKTLCACITLEAPINFDAVDQTPIDVIFAMLVPEDAEADHLASLAAIAGALQDEHYVQKLRTATDSVELFNIATQSSA